MNVVVLNKEGGVITTLKRSDIYEIHEIPNMGFSDVRLHYILKLHYNAQLWSIMQDAHTLFESDHSNYKIEIYAVTIDQENPFIIVKGRTVEGYR